MQKTEANYQDLLKLIALIAMVLDHTGLYFFPYENAFRIIGRYAMPIFCFFAGYNFKGHLRFKILIYGIILYFISTFFIFKTYHPANILISIFLGLLCLKAFDKYLKNFWTGYSLVIIFGCLWFFTENLFDYGTYSIVIVTLGYMAKQQSELKLWFSLASSIIAFFHTYFIFNPYFSNMDLIFTIVVYFVCFASLNLAPYNKKISLNLLPIRHKLAEIYFAHVLLIQLIWLYYFKN